MQNNGMDFRRKEVINIKDGKRLRICARCMCRFGNRKDNFYNGCKKENRYSRFEFERIRKKKNYVTKNKQKRTGYVVKEKYCYDVVCKVEL